MVVPLWLHDRAGTDRRTREAPRNRGVADIDMALGEACSCSCLLFFHLQAWRVHGMLVSYTQISLLSSCPLVLLSSYPLVGRVGDLPKAYKTIVGGRRRTAQGFVETEGLIGSDRTAMTKVNCQGGAGVGGGLTLLERYVNGLMLLHYYRHTMYLPRQSGHSASHPCKRQELGPRPLENNFTKCGPATSCSFSLFFSSSTTKLGMMSPLPLHMSFRLCAGAC